jgi:hypothetical protein
MLRNARSEASAMFRMPIPVKITGRTSTITNSFVNAIIPVFMPSEDDVRQALSVLGMTIDDLRCVYCGDGATEWDHLRPLVKGQRPTGYVSEIANLVPACGKCNQSKSGHDWKTWIQGNARLSPRMRKIPSLADRISRLEAFEKWRNPRRIDFESFAGKERWAKHWENHGRLLELMRECQLTAEEIRLLVSDAARLQVADGVE